MVLPKYIMNTLIIVITYLTSTHWCIKGFVIISHHNPLEFKNWNKRTPSSSCSHVTTASTTTSSTTTTSNMMRSSTVLFQQAPEMEGNFGESDEELFLAIMNEKIQQEVDEGRASSDTNDNDLHTSLSGYKGAGVPRLSLAPEDIVPVIMKALQNNDFPETNAGLVSMWEFTTDTTKFIFHNNVTGE
jgi:hypothetical protein